jgi:hypothetical protein
MARLIFSGAKPGAVNLNHLPQVGGNRHPQRLFYLGTGLGLITLFFPNARGNP